MHRPAAIVYWFGGLRPGGLAVGIGFERLPLGAGLATLVVLVTASLVFCWRYFRGVATYYHGLMLIFLAGMAGFCLTGDLFNLFVFFELMGVAAYALTGYRVEEVRVSAGALNFAIVNSIGASCPCRHRPALRPHRHLNMAQIGRAPSAVGRRMGSSSRRSCSSPPASSSRARPCRSTSGSPTRTRWRRRPSACSSPA